MISNDTSWSWAGKLLSSLSVGLICTATPLIAEMEPSLTHPEQTIESLSKLQSLVEQTGKRPNILIFIVDDMGWGDAGCYGGGHAIGAPTPNIDRLAREGLQLTSCYSQPTCSPSRATLMTGRLPIRHGVYRPVMYGEHGGIENEITSAQLLKDAGYTTQLVGKWHVGDQPFQQPQNCGYDDFYGFLGVANMYTEWRDPHHNPELVYDKELCDNVTKNFNHHLVHAKGGQPLEDVTEITIPVLANLDQMFADYTDNFLREMADSEKPFYCIHAFSKVHFDSYPADGYEGKSPAKHPYKDGILEVDDIVGRLIATLKETGLDENTLVFFTSDNGPEEELWPDAGATPFKMGKGTTCEGGVRVPGIFWWPGMIPAGRISDGLFDFCDLFPTCASLAGVYDRIPDDRYIDGVDQTSFLLADEGESNRRAVYYWILGELSAVRVGPYKYYRKVFQVNDGFHGAMGGMQGSLVDLPYGQLYNLYIDPAELRPILIRKTWITSVLTDTTRNHIASLMRWPPKKPSITID